MPRVPASLPCRSGSLQTPSGFRSPCRARLEAAACVDRAAGSGHCRAAGETPAPSPQPLPVHQRGHLVLWARLALSCWSSGQHTRGCACPSVWDLLSWDLLLEPKSVDGARSRLPWPVGGGGGEVSRLSSVTWGRGRGSLSHPRCQLCGCVGSWASGCHSRCCSSQGNRTC